MLSPHPSPKAKFDRFLWIQLQLTSLWDPNLVTCDEDIRQQLIALPEGLEETYVRCLQRIETNANSRSQDIAIRVFKWVACAREPLTPLQAREAVSLSADSIPLIKSKLLTHPVEDYCANLVVRDEITGRIVFTHPTVKHFLQDPMKLPLHLSKYVLSIKKDNLWCGEICLAYMHYICTPRQVVPYTTQSVPPNFTNSIMKNVPGGWIASKFRKPTRNLDFRIASPTKSANRADEALDCTLHDYMRKNWLSHNQNINENAENYRLFSNLCLSSSSEILPWAAKSVSEEDCFRKLVEHAVLTDHVPLLHLAHTHIKHGRSHLLTKVFRSNCPGTDSSWLHIGATLGSEQIIFILAQVCDLTAINA